MTTPSTGPIACRACDLHEVCRLGGLIALGDRNGTHRTGALRTLRAGTRLYRAGEPAHSLFAVRQGMLKTVEVGTDGEERIITVNTPGDVLGTEAFGRRMYSHDVVALQPVVCCELPLSLLSEQYSRVRELAAALINLLSRASAPRAALARGSIRERVAGLLLELARRFEQRGLDGRRFSLGMTRQEIASLLDTRIETVSRMIQKLHRERAIEITGQQVTLLSLKPTG
ncbi:MAG: Fumarate and nitrate reduction regulatory protein [Steroidobacteraceae bacterium]|nr:Fumarate and nitrate reduction regulatory protein [Steroidobacteraceae bacterium]